MNLDQAKRDFLADQLEHSGVKGMRWGVTHDPKPVTAEKQAKRDDKSAKFVSKANTVQGTIDKLTAQRDSTTNRYAKTNIQGMIDEQSKVKITALKDARASKEGRLTSTQKKLIIGGSVVAAVVATKIIVNNTENGQFNRLAMKGKALLSGDKSAQFAKDLKLANPNLTSDEVHKLVVSKINPEYGAMGTKQNCRRATFAYEMRRRGNDVMATRTTNASGQNGVGLINALSPGEKIRPTGTFGVIKQNIKEASGSLHDPTPLKDITSEFAAGGKNKILSGTAGRSASIFETLAQQPNGSRGELGVTWKAGGGHSMAYEIFNGKPVIFDNQSGKQFKDLAEFTTSGMAAQVKEAGFTRLDNVPLNSDYLMRWLKNAK